MDYIHLPTLNPHAAHGSGCPGGASLLANPGADGAARGSL